MAQPPTLSTTLHPGPSNISMLQFLNGRDCSALRNPHPLPYSICSSLIPLEQLCILFRSRNNYTSPSLTYIMKFTVIDFHLRGHRFLCPLPLFFSLPHTGFGVRLFHPLTICPLSPAGSGWLHTVTHTAFDVAFLFSSLKPNVEE